MCKKCQIDNFSEFWKLINSQKVHKIFILPQIDLPVALCNVNYILAKRCKEKKGDINLENYVDKSKSVAIMFSVFETEETKKDKAMKSILYKWQVQKLKIDDIKLLYKQGIHEMK